MFLKKVYINGFKSFAYKTELNVQKGITAVVGPNGSGKSNISDAIKWVLGEQSARSLRGGKMDDIIFAGTQKLSPLGYAEVNLIFDNEMGIIPLEYKEVSIKRRLYRTGESEYYINKNQCRLKDVKELFMDTGVGRDGYSFIGQGRVEDILSPNSETRREVFEEAIGIVKFKTRKEDAQKKLEKTNENLDRVDDIVASLKERIEPLREQSEKAIKYVQLKEKVKNHELNYFAHEYEKHNDQLVALTNQRDIMLEEKDSLQKKRDYFLNSITSKKDKILELQNIISINETSYNSKNKELDNYQSLSKVHSEKSFLYQTNIKSIEDEILVIDERNDKLKFTESELEKDKLKLEESLKLYTEKFSSLNEDIELYKIEIEKLNKEINDEKNELFEFHKDINRLNSSKSSLESFIKNNEDRIGQILDEVNFEKKEKLNLEENIKVSLEEQENIKKYIYEKNTLVEKNTEELKVEETRKINIETNIKKLNDEFAHAKSKLNILSNMEAYYDGYYKSIKTLMTNKEKNQMLKQSIMGTVADIISTKKEYETAIEIALGSAIQNVIVNSENEASNIIEYLKNNKIGRVTFLPIDMIQERTLNQNEKSVLSDPCVVNTADMLVETDSKFSKVIKNLLGRIIVVDNLKNGFKISKKLGNTVRIVSLQGDVINAGGSVTGGHIQTNQNILGRKREIDECKIRSEELSKSILTNEEKLKECISKVKLINENILDIKNNINDQNNLYITIKSKIEMLNQQMEKSDTVIAKYMSEIDYIKEDIKKLEKEITEIDEEIKKVKIDIVEKESKIESISIKNEENKVKFDLNNSEVLKQREEVSTFSQGILIIEEKIKNIYDEINRNLDLKKSKIENLENIKNEIENAEELIKEYTEKSELLTEEITKLSEKLNVDKKDLETLQNDIYESQNKINESNNLLTTMLDDENSINIKIEREKSKVEDISSKLWEEYEMSYAMALPYKNDSVNINKVFSELNILKKEIKSLGNVNLDSVEEYKEVYEKYNFLEKQKQDLELAKKQLNDVIKELETNMREKFQEEFLSIRKKFSEVFKNLFNGGMADVYLEDENDQLNSNIEIAVQPPGKKLSKISLLSGGEKALTAIALLFAILKTKPTPFCILDEIEAALDDANIYRFAEYLREFSKETQFIVITHRKATMEYVDTLYGATMEEKGVTKLVSLKLSEVDF